jgi:hypothetical protein
MLSMEGPLFATPADPWDGVTRPHPVHDMNERKRNATTVNVDALRAHVEGIIDNVRAEHEKGNVVLYDSTKAEDVIAYGQIFVG